LTFTPLGLTVAARADVDRNKVELSAKIVRELARICLVNFIISG
jgi:hypothetical protein